MNAALPMAYRLTFADWRAFAHDGRLYELIEGEVHVSPAPSVNHQRLVGRLFRRLQDFLESNSRGEAFIAPTGVRLSDDVVVEPDIVVVLKKHAARVRPEAILGAPDLLIEVLSPGTARHDLTTKRELYARFAVPEYWILDPEKKSIERLVLEGGRYPHGHRVRGASSLESKCLPGFSIRVGDLFR